MPVSMASSGLTSLSTVALVEWSPEAMPHVKSRYEQRTFDPETGEAETQRFWCECLFCGAAWQGDCTSGRVRSRVKSFALAHTHRDPMTNRRA